MQYSAWHFPLCHREANTPFSPVLSQPLLLLWLRGWTGMDSPCESQWGTRMHVSTGRGSCYACMHAWLRPFQLWFQENIAWPRKNRCLGGKVTVNRETGQLLCIFSYFFQQTKIWLKISVWHAENKVRDKCLLSFELSQWRVLCRQCSPVVFISTAFFPILLFLWVEVLIKGMVKGKIEHFNKMSS